MAGDAAHALQDEDRVIETDWDKFGLDTYAVGEAARRDEDGYFWVMGRVDDVFKRRGPPHVHSEIRVGDRVAREGRRGGRDRADRLRDLGSYQGNGDDQLISDLEEKVSERQSGDEEWGGPVTLAI